MLSDDRSRELIQRACETVRLVHTTTRIESLLLDLVEKQLFWIPKECLKKCVCTRLAKHCSAKPWFEYHYKRIKNVRDIDDYIVDNCPYDLTNIAIPVKNENQVVAVLHVGPILTKSPEEILKAHVLSQPEMSTFGIEDMRDAVAFVPRRNMAFVNNLARTIAMLVNDDFAESCMRSILAEGSLANGCSNQTNSRRIQAALCYIAENYSYDISLDDVAKSIFLSPAHLRKLLHKYTNTSFKEHLNRCRLYKAQQLLLDSSSSIATICCTVGFSDQSYFDKIFKSTFGVTPTQFRKQNQP